MNKGQELGAEKRPRHENLAISPWKNMEEDQDVVFVKAGIVSLFLSPATLRLFKWIKEIRKARFKIQMGENGLRKISLGFSI